MGERGNERAQGAGCLISAWSTLTPGWTRLQERRGKYVYNLSAGASKKITNDVADDLYPRFIENSSKIIFSSNRLSDTLKVDNTIKPKISYTYDLYVYDRDTNSENVLVLGGIF